MTGENRHIDGGLSDHFRNALRGVVQLQIYGLSLWIVDLDLLGGFPALAGLTPHEMVEFVDSCTHTYLKREYFFLFRSLFK